MEERPLTSAPDDSPCWSGPWARVDGLTDVWAQAAVNRTVRALPQLHPWRLGDAKGSSRLLQWVGRRAAPAGSSIVPPGGGGGGDGSGGGSGDDGGGALGVLTVTARDADLDRTDDPAPGALGDLLSGGLVRGGLLGGGEDVVTGLVTDVLGRAFGAGRRTAVGDAPRWAGVLVRMPGSWLPPVAWLPRGLRDLDDPGTAWQTESLAFADRWSVHAEDLRTSAALLTPTVMAVLMDRVPSSSAVTLCGDALHVWWPYQGDAVRVTGRVAAAADAAAGLVSAFPRFVLDEHPDRSDVLEGALAERRAAAHAYREAREAGTAGAAGTAGTTTDPVMRRIYAQARRDAGLPP